MDDSQGRELTRSMHRSTGSFELVLSPVLLGLFGFLADRWLGTLPVLTVICVLVGFSGACVRLYYGYKHEMAQHEIGQPWAKS